MFDNARTWVIKRKHRIEDSTVRSVNAAFVFTEGQLLMRKGSVCFVALARKLSIQMPSLLTIGVIKAFNSIRIQVKKPSGIVWEKKSVITYTGDFTQIK